jgi:hypothetical protein
MMKPLGWRQEPARHALASKGIETGKSTQKRVGREAPLALPPKAMRSGTPVVNDQVKAVAVDRILVEALEEGGDKAGAIRLLENDEWLEREAKKIAEAESAGFMQRAALKQELIRTIRKNPPVSNEEGD